MTLTVNQARDEFLADRQDAVREALNDTRKDVRHLSAFCLRIHDEVHDHGGAAGHRLYTRIAQAREHVDAAWRAIGYAQQCITE